MVRDEALDKDIEGLTWYNGRTTERMWHGM